MTIQEHIDVITISGTEYFHDRISSISGQSPKIVAKVNDIRIVGLNIDDDAVKLNLYQEDTNVSPDIELNDSFKSGDIVVYKYAGALVLLTGYDKYLEAVSNGKKEISARLISKPVLKRASLVVFVKPDPEPKPRNHFDKDKPRRFNREHVAQPVQNNRPKTNGRTSTPSKSSNPY